MEKIYAKSISYDSTKERKLSDVKAIVIHNTGNDNDTAVNNAKYFANSNTRSAGAHYFVDQKGNVVKSIPLKRAAWAVGGSKYKNCTTTGGGEFYGIYTNYNTVSIELCDIVNKEPSEQMIKATKKLIKQIRKSCPNAKKIIRHFDVNGKPCPAMMSGKKNVFRWLKFLKDIGELKENSK
jgi:N-acetylmuramoyl-L-alanine amidase CwlA